MPSPIYFYILKAVNLIEEVPNLEMANFPKFRGMLKFQSRLIIYHLPNLGKSLNSTEPIEVKLVMAVEARARMCPVILLMP